MTVVEDAGNVVDDGDSLEGVLPSFLIRRLGIWRNGYLDGETPHDVYIIRSSSTL